MANAKFFYLILQKSVHYVMYWSPLPNNVSVNFSKLVRERNEWDCHRRAPIQRYFMRPAEQTRIFST